MCLYQVAGGKCRYCLTADYGTHRPAVHRFYDKPVTH